MRIFSDLHHSDLYASFHHLFETRLGHELYRPIGEEWFKMGYWKIAEPYNNHPATVSQFLSTDYIPTDGTNPLNNVQKEDGGTYYVWDGQRNYHQKAVTLERFLELDVDVIIASIPAHIESYKKLIKDYNLRAKLIYHIGNIGWHDMVPWHAVDNVMASVREFPVPDGKHAIFYRQEFDLSIFKPSSEPPMNWITSFVNLLPERPVWEEFARLLPEFEHKAFGIGCPDGIISSLEGIAGIMRESMFGFHNKPFGDGFGHIIHNWMAVGRPVIVNLNDYKDKLAGELLIDGVTCINLSGHRIDEVVRMVRNMTKEQYDEMVHNVKKTFDQFVDFEADSKRVKEFLNGLK